MAKVWNRRRARVATFVFALAAVLTLSVLASDVDASLTARDVEAIARLDVDAECTSRRGFRGEVGCVRAVQAALVRLVPDLKCSPKEGGHEPMDLLERGHGCCFDRSRLQEKTLRHYGFETRHVSIYMSAEPGALDLLTATRSHAISEVLTSRGWMLFDSNSDFVALASDEPLDAHELRQALRVDAASIAGNSKAVRDAFFDGNFAIFYGLYSRHGAFYPPILPVPDVDWAEAWHNVARD